MIDSFTGENYFLSNSSHSKIRMNGLTFNNGEAAFQSHKDPSRAAEFVGLNPSAARKLGRSVKLREDWEEVKDHIMYQVTVAKFSQNLHLKKRLLATGDKDLVAGNDWNDKYWGVYNGEGKNMLGRILMLTREYLKHKDNIDRLIADQKSMPEYKIIKENLIPTKTDDWKNPANFWFHNLKLKTQQKVAWIF